jgi:hypothetical protein
MNDDQKTKYERERVRSTIHRKGKLKKDMTKEKDEDQD